MIATGKWTQPGIPRKGWSCVDTDDLGSPDHVCENVRARGRSLCPRHGASGLWAVRVSCICAGHMEENLDGARKRAAFKANRKRRARWLTREWQPPERAINISTPTDSMLSSFPSTVPGAQESLIARPDGVER
jgi:hypothetical protein